jgi:hypothetical protein
MTTCSTISKIVHALILSLFVTCITAAWSSPALAKQSKGNKASQQKEYLLVKFNEAYVTRQAPPQKPKLNQTVGTGAKVR